MLYTLRRIINTRIFSFLLLSTCRHLSNRILDSKVHHLPFLNLGIWAYVFTASMLENNNFWLLGRVQSWQKIYLHWHWHTLIFYVLQLNLNILFVTLISFYLYSTVFVWSSVCTSLLFCDWLMVSVSTNQRNTAKLPAVYPDSLLEWTAVVSEQSADQFYKNIFDF